MRGKLHKHLLKLDGSELIKGNGVLNEYGTQESLKCDTKTQLDRDQLPKILNWDIISSRVEQENIRQDLKFILRFIAVLPKSKKTFNAVSKFTADDKAKVIKYLNP